ncbi:MAG: TrpR-like protein, YerC/YecD [Ruminococcaceae bacterium]|nr:TrpR-like protein, YerC/YecD [Oscillospiraceae bacterium]
MKGAFKDENIDFLIRSILALETEEEVFNFFCDLCTVTELQSISQRLVVAKMLSDKEVYSDIVKKTKASTATISRVNRSLKYGNDGYEVVFDRIREQEK